MNQLTDILTKRFGVDAEALSAAERLKGEKGGHLGEILVQQKAISEAQLLEALSAQFEIPFWPKLPLNDIDTDVLANVPIQFLKKHWIVPLNCRKPLTALDCGLTPWTRPTRTTPCASPAA